MIINYFLFFLIASGVAVWVFVLIYVGVYVVGTFIEACQRTLYEWKIKHRFKNPPIAKCYCMDCVRYEEKRGYCRCFSAHNIPTNAFCVFAEPKKEDKQE